MKPIQIWIYYHQHLKGFVRKNFINRWRLIDPFTLVVEEVVGMEPFHLAVGEEEEPKMGVVVMEQNRLVVVVEEV